LNRFDPSPRTLAFALATAIGATLAACGGSDDGGDPAPKPAAKPELGKATLVDVPDRHRRRLVVSVPVHYPSSRGVQAGHRVEGVTATVAVRDRSGRRRELEAKPEPGVYLPGRKRRTVHAHLFLSDGDARAVRRVVGRGHAATVSARANIGRDGDDDGATGDRSSVSSSTPVSDLTPAEAAVEREQPRETLQGSGSDPCDTVATYQGPADCVNKRGETWEAGGFMHSKTEQIYCPRGYGPVNEIPLFFGGDPAHTIDTSSKHYTHGSGFLRNGVGANVSITDYNLHGHPIAYTPVLACCKPDDPNDGDACEGD